MNGVPVHSSNGFPPGDHGESIHRTSRKLGKSRRLTTSAQIREAYEQRHKQVGKYMVLWLRSADDASCRVAVVASRKVGNAVKRSRARRRLRDVFRRNQNRLTGTNDMVLVARGDIIRADAASIESEFLELASRAGVYKPE